jgi:RNA polymerase sigma factor (sigma-70 family)
METIESLYEQYLPKIYRYIYHRTGHRQLAEDLTSTVFLKVAKNLDTFDANKSSISTWIYAIARNTLIDHMRTNKPTFDLSEADDLASAENVEQSTERSLQIKAVRGALSKLNEAQREVLIMRVWDDLSHKEIANILGISEDSSKMTFSRAVSNLKQAVNIGEII